MSIPKPSMADLEQRRQILLGNSPKGLFIDGDYRPALSGRTFPTTNPANGEILATIAHGGPEDVDVAVAVARRAFEGPWSRLPPYERQALILRFCDLIEARFDDLSLLDTLEMGAPFGRSRVSTFAALRFAAGMATALHGETVKISRPGDSFAYTVLEPIGVVAAIMAWNGPLPASIAKIAPVIATGCTMVLKPSEEASLTALLLAELAIEAGFPAGVINVVTGFGDIGAHLAAHADVDKVAFTGSSATGKAIVEASAGNLKRVALELGGKSPHVIFADADLEAAAQAAAFGVFANSGQICSSGSRVFIEQPVYDQVVERIVEIGRSLPIGNGLDPNTRVGPLVSAKQLARVSRYIESGRDEGARLLCGGARLMGSEHANGNFMPPTVFTGVQDGMEIAREEIFGPVLSAISFADFDEVARRANDTRFGLAAGVWTRDLAKAHRMAARIRAGSIWVNTYFAFDAALPFGGYKESGYGRESGIQQMQEYMQTKSVAMAFG